MLAGSRSPGSVTSVLPFGPVVSAASQALLFQDRIPGEMLRFIGSHRPPSAGLGHRVVAPPGAPRLICSKQHVAYDSPGVIYRGPVLLTSAQRCSRFVTLARPSSGTHLRWAPVVWVRLAALPHDPVVPTAYPAPQLQDRTLSTLEDVDLLRIN
ncbi:hypothetical protein NDU88_006833 [Pleurodeles waltl]|uniref:Uncharacterized protein n=1 Tax=Pleurodeles waltl TaxID=8319 RepID=A0AAV7VNW7_PLEWA|nr:hypothetical protein NDU88_006833 [Pleurodeles waltl]